MATLAGARCETKDSEDLEPVLNLSGGSRGLQKLYCFQEYPCQVLIATVMQGQAPLEQWQIDFIGPLP